MNGDKIRSIIAQTYNSRLASHNISGGVSKNVAVKDNQVQRQLSPANMSSHFSPFKVNSKNNLSMSGLYDLYSGQSRDKNTYSYIQVNNHLKFIV